MRRAGAALALAVVLLAAPARAAPAPECLLPLLLSELQAKRAFHSELATLLAAVAPEHLSLTRLSAQTQIALAERRLMRATALLDRDPNRLATPAALAAIAWTERDESALQRDSREYRLLSERTNALAAANDTDPRWPALQTAYRERLRQEPTHKALLKLFAAEMQAIAARIEACFD
ncbi:MAG: hypothetical protein AAGI34_09245 [Pseudomonadota bacterium]